MQTINKCIFFLKNIFKNLSLFSISKSSIIAKATPTNFSIWSLEIVINYHTYFPAPIVLYKKFQQETNEEMPQEVLYCGRLMQYLKK